MCNTNILLCVIYAYMLCALIFPIWYQSSGESVIQSRIKPSVVCASERTSLLFEVKRREKSLIS
jgi:hypothetical protein